MSYVNDRDDISTTLAHVEREILNTYGDRVSFVRKAKSVKKFGRNGDIGTTRETVWRTGGNETYVTDNLIDAVVSSSGSDTEVVRIEGYTVTGTGADQEFTFVVQSATLAGQTPVALTTPLARVSRLTVEGETNNAGVIYVYEDTATVTAGVPQEAALIHMSIRIGDNQSFKAATTFSKEDYFAVTSFTLSVSKKTDAVADGYLEVRTPGSVFKPKATLTASRSSGTIEMMFDPPIIIPKNSDVRVTAASTASATDIYAQFQGYLASIF